MQFNYEGVIIANNYNATVSLFVYGGHEVTNRITFFVNHKPVKVNGVDFLEVQMKYGQMLLIDIELSLDNLNEFNSLCAIMMTTGSDYTTQEMFKTRSILLVNE